MRGEAGSCAGRRSAGRSGIGIRSLAAALILGSAIPLGAQVRVPDTDELRVYGEADYDWTLRPLDGEELELET